MPGEQKLSLNIEAKGGEETARKLDAVSQAQDKITGKTGETGEKLDQASAAQQKLNASQSDYVSLLTQINPVLGGLVDGLLRSGNIAGDLASKNINLKGTFASLSTSVKKNASALKLIGAGGAVVLGIVAISNAISAMAREFEKATQAIRDQIAALNELKGKQEDQKKAIEALADARSEGGFTAEQARVAAKKAQQIGERSPFLEDASVNQAVALGGQDKSVEQLSQIAFLIQSNRLDVPPGLSEANRESRIENALQRFASEIQTAFAREVQQGQSVGIKGDVIQQALKELNSQTGSTQNLKAVLKQFALAGQDLDKLAEIARNFGSSAEIRKFDDRTISTALDVPQADTIDKVLQFLKVGASFGFARDDRIAGTPAERTSIAAALQSLTTAVKKNTEATLRHSGIQTTVNNNQGAHFKVSDPMSQKRRTRNGQSRRELTGN